MGNRPAATNAVKVANPLREARPRDGRVAAVIIDLMESTLLVPIENPSARRFGTPNMSMTLVDIAAPVMLAITISVVTMPSFAPKTKSGR